MLTIHVTVSVGWIGALTVFLAHTLVGLTAEDDQIIRAVSVAMGLTAWYVILPLSLAALATGLIQALGTPWGLFRHYWVCFKLLLAAFATGVLILKMAPIGYLADTAKQSTFSATELVVLRTSLAFHAAGGLAVLLTVAALGIYKPTGLTAYGIHKHTAAVRVKPDSRPPADVPRWVKGSGIAAILLILLGIVMMIVGNHGPGVQLPS